MLLASAVMMLYLQNLKSETFCHSYKVQPISRYQILYQCQCPVSYILQIPSAQVQNFP